LGGITEAEVTEDVERCIRFWEKATKQLDKLQTRISAEERRRIEFALAARVPPPTSRKLRRHDRLRQQRKVLRDLDNEQRIMELELELEEERELFG
jgi:cell wall assembly regulator SMI1